MPYSDILPMSTIKEDSNEKMKNNLIIELLIALHSKLAKLAKKYEEKSDIDKLTEQMGALKAIDPKPSTKIQNPFFMPDYKFGYRISK